MAAAGEGTDAGMVDHVIVMDGVSGGGECISSPNVGISSPNGAVESLSLPSELMDHVIVMDGVSGGGESVSSPNGAFERSPLRIMRWLRGALTERVDPETLSRENKENLIVASPILSCNATVITTVTTDSSFLGQAVLAQSTVALMLCILVIASPLANPALSSLKLKRFALVSASFFTICSFLAYVSMKMEPVIGTAAATNFFSGGFVFSATILFLTQTVFGPSLQAIQSPQPVSSQPQRASAPATVHSMPPLNSGNVQIAN